MNRARQETSLIDLQQLYPVGTRLMVSMTKKIYIHRNYKELRFYRVVS